MTAVQQLGYVGFEVSDLDAWRTFARKVLGLMVHDTGDRLRLRNDSRAWRIQVTEGPADDLALIGWQVADGAALETLARRLRDAGIDVSEGSAADAAERQVQGLISYRDPAGVPSELYYGLATAETPFSSDKVRSGFVADEQGFGHCVLTTKDRDASLRFYSEVLGFKLSDYIKCEYFGYDVDLVFLHVNPRHHTLALGGGLDKHLHHFMLQVGAMDDVGLAFDRAIRSGTRIAQTLGKHPNDQMFSFYAHTPSGFQFEYGWGAREVDDATWEPTTYDCISEWGHHPPAMLAPRKKRKPPTDAPESGGTK